MWWFFIAPTFSSHSNPILYEKGSGYVFCLSVILSAVSELAAEQFPCPIELVGVRDRFGKSGEFNELLTYFGLDADALVQAVEKARARKHA